MILQATDDNIQSLLSQQSRGAAANVNRIDGMRDDIWGDAVCGREILPPFQFTLKVTRVMIEDGSPLHARAEVAKAAFGRAKRDLDVDAEGQHLIGWNSAHFGHSRWGYRWMPPAFNLAP